MNFTLNRSARMARETYAENKKSVFFSDGTFGSNKSSPAVRKLSNTLDDPLTAKGCSANLPCVSELSLAYAARCVSR